METPRLNFRLNAQIREEATEWLIAFSEGDVGARARDDFNTWLRFSPEHVRAYLRISAFWEAADRIDKARKRELDDLVQYALAESNVVSLSEAPSSPRPPPGLAPRHRLAIAASLLVICVTTTVVAWLEFAAPTYATAIGEQRSITLPDGSIVALNARSRIRVRFSTSQRRIELLEGQALFRVARNAARPFIVRSNGLSVKAVGTEFDVDRKSSETVVTVLEGHVAISTPLLKRGAPSPARRKSELVAATAAPTEGPTLEPGEVMLAAGEQIIVTAQAVTAPSHANLATAAAWTEGLLVFDAAPLSEVIEEFNRHNIKPMIIDDAELRALQISGTFPETGSARLTEFLRQRFGVVIQENDDAIRVSRR